MMAGNDIVQFPIGNTTQANAYKASADAAYAIITGVPGDQFCYVRLDSTNHPCAPYLGPPWEFITGIPVAEPSACKTAREAGGGVVISGGDVVWPNED